MNSAYNIVLEFSRARQAGQPHAFEFVPQTYLLRNPGGGFESAEFPWTRDLLEDLRIARIPGAESDVIHRIGDILRGFLSGAGWSHHEHAIVRAAREGARITVTIRSAAAELYALPWEFVALKSTGQLLGGVPGLMVRYEWPETSSFPDRISAAARRGRVLFAWSAAGGAVPAERHLAALEAAFAGNPGAFDPERDVIAHATFARIDQALAEAARQGPPIDALHLLCHGRSNGATYGLTLDDTQQSGLAVTVGAGRVQQLLAPHAGMVRMIVLAACDSGNAGELGNHLGSVAQMIHRAGVQAVVASRFPLSAAGSAHFAAAFYTELARAHAPLESAFLAARGALLRDPSQLDWASVQLFSRDDDGDATYPLHLDPLPPALPAAALAPPILLEVPAPPPVPPPVPLRRRILPLGLGAALIGMIVMALVLTPPPVPSSLPLPAAPPTAASLTAASPTAASPTTASPTATPPTAAPSVVVGTGGAPISAPAGPLLPAAPIAAKPSPAAKKPTPRSGAGKCSQAVIGYLDSLLPDRADGEVKVELAIEVPRSGLLSVGNSEYPDHLERAADKLLAASSERLIELGGAGLPCKTTIIWRP